MVFKLKQKIANTITPVWLSFMTDFGRFPFTEKSNAPFLMLPFGQKIDEFDTHFKDTNKLGSDSAD